MGYYTGYSLVVLDENLYSVEDERTDLIVEKLEDISGYSFDGYYVYGKWYSYDEDMLQLSTLYPEFIFQLTGHGESAGDYWRAWYQDGTTYAVDAHLPEFDKGKMQ